MKPTLISDKHRSSIGSFPQIKILRQGPTIVPRNAPPFPCIKATDTTMMFGGAYCGNSLLFQQYAPLPVANFRLRVHTVEIF